MDASLPNPISSADNACTRDFFDALAPFADLAYGGDDHEPAFLVDVLGRPRGRILELGVGTGRITLALAQAGWEVVGIEQSRAMLDIAQRKLADAGLDHRVHLKQGTANGVDDNERFDCVVAIGLFFHQCVPSGYQSVLEGCFDALRPGGLFIFDVECRPDGGWVSDGVVRLVACRRQGDTHVALYQAATKATGHQEQIGIFTIETSDATTGATSRRVIHQRGSWVTHDQIGQLAQAAGFTIERSWGDWFGKAHNPESPELILQVRRPED